MELRSSVDKSHDQMKGFGQLSSETPSCPSITAAHKYHALTSESSRRLDVPPSFSVERVEELHKIVLVLVCQLERDNQIVLAGGLVS